MYFTASVLTVYVVSSKVRTQSKARTHTTRTHIEQAQVTGHLLHFIGLIDEGKVTGRWSNVSMSRFDVLWL